MLSSSALPTEMQQGPPTSDPSLPQPERSQRPPVSLGPIFPRAALALQGGPVHLAGTVIAVP